MEEADGDGWEWNPSKEVMEASSSLMEVGGLGDAGPDAGDDPKAAADSLFPMITVSISYHICKK